jgi:hypothetical protein
VAGGVVVPTVPPVPPTTSEDLLGVMGLPSLESISLDAPHEPSPLSESHTSVVQALILLSLTEVAHVQRYCLTCTPQLSVYTVMSQFKVVILSVYALNLSVLRGQS